MMACESDETCTKHLLQSGSVNRAILKPCFVWFGNTGADAAIAILLPTLKRFICNGVVEWSIRCFSCFYKNGDSFAIVQREF